MKNIVVLPLELLLFFQFRLVFLLELEDKLGSEFIYISRVGQAIFANISEEHLIGSGQSRLFKFRNYITYNKPYYFVVSPIPFPPAISLLRFPYDIAPSFVLCLS